MNDMQIQCFIKSVELGSFTKAAPALFVSPATVSRNASAFEDELNLVLFIRTSSNVTVTPAGEMLYKWLIEARKDYDKLLDAARKAEAAAKDALVIGLPHSQMLNPPLQQAREAMHGKIEIALRRYSGGDLLDSLYGGATDISGALNFKRSLELPDVSSLLVYSTETLLVLPTTHPLASKRTRPLSDFKNETFIVFPNQAKQSQISNQNILLDIFKLSGFTPKICVPPDSGTYSLWIEAGWGIGVGNTDHLICNSPSLTEIHVPELAQYPTNFFLLWLNANRNPAIPRFIKTLNKKMADTAL